MLDDKHDGEHLTEDPDFDAALTSIHEGRGDWWSEPDAWGLARAFVAANAPSAHAEPTIVLTNGLRIVFWVHGWAGGDSVHRFSGDVERR